MPRYKLDIEEKTTRTHEVVIETDKIDTICNYIERNNNGIGDPWDIRYIAGVNLISVEEGAEDFPEFEVLDVKEDGEKNDES